MKILWLLVKKNENIVVNYKCFCIREYYENIVVKYCGNFSALEILRNEIRISKSLAKIEIWKM